MRGEEFLLQGEQNCGHLSSLSGRAIALGSEPRLVTRIVRTGLSARLLLSKEKDKRRL